VVDLSTQELLLHGVEVMYVPLVLALIAVLALASIHGLVTWIMMSEARDFVSRWIATFAVLVGLILLLRSMIGIFVPEVAETEYPGGTPLALAIAPLSIAYGVWILRSIAVRRARTQGKVTWVDSRAAKQLTRVILPCVAAVLIAGLFWAVNTFAAAYGSGRAEVRAERLGDDPSIVIDTAERIVGLSSDVVTESELAPREGEVFRYRYEGLRLLTESNGRLFLVPTPWREGESWTLVIPYDERIRIQFIP
jgi:hypothetical protein